MEKPLMAAPQSEPPAPSARRLLYLGAQALAYSVCLFMLGCGNCKMVWA